MKDIFSEKQLLEAYDQILPLSEHYKSIISNHLEILSSAQSVVDLACGTGNLTIEYLHKGKRVTAVDINAVSLEILQKKVSELGYDDQIRIIEADTTNLNTLSENQFDGASSMIAAHLISDYGAHISEAFRVLKPKGVLVITARAANGDQALLVDSVKESLIRLGKFNDFRDEFDLLSANLLMTANERSPSLKTDNEAARCLKEVGFSNIESVPNKTLGVMYTLVAQKP